MATAVAPRSAPTSPASTATRSREYDAPPTVVADEVADDLPVVLHDRSSLEAAARRWLAEGDTPENVAAYASALRALLRSH